MTSIATQLSHVQSEIADATERAGRSPGSVRLVAVCKTHPASAVIDAAAAGQTVFGESRVQEAKDKIPLCPPGLQWHFIGHLQKNKIRAALPLFDFFHSIDSLPLATGISRIASETGRTVHGLLEVNVSGEATKHGFTPDALRGSFREVIALPNLRITGLMTMAPYDTDPLAARPFFHVLRELRDELQSSTGHPLPELSMGMSGDFVPAIEEGSTLVRVGTSIFGSRPYPQP
jgi:pyridoxal phosphate enzyme (YggS family)